MSWGEVPEGIDSRWEKMSKSKGNVIDPLEMIDLYGADAVRMALAAVTTHASQIDLDRRRFEEFKNFANKIWNGARFVFMNMASFEMGNGIDTSLLLLEDRWILSRLNRVIEQVNKYFSEYAYDKAALATYDFFWKEFCSSYVEMTKPVLFGKLGTLEQKNNKQKILVVVLSNAIRLLHPMAPFITEKLFQILKERVGLNHPIEDLEPYAAEAITSLKAAACMIAPYPKVICGEAINPKVEEEFSLLQQLIQAIRNLRAEMKVSVIKTLHVVVIGEKRLFVDRHEGLLRALLRIENLLITEEEPNFSRSARVLVDEFKLIFPIFCSENKKERELLTKQHEKLIQKQQQLSLKLKNREFILRAPQDLIEKFRLSLEQVEKQLLEINKALDG